MSSKTDRDERRKEELGDKEGRQNGQAAAKMRSKGGAASR